MRLDISVIQCRAKKIQNNNKNNNNKIYINIAKTKRITKNNITFIRLDMSVIQCRVNNIQLLPWGPPPLLVSLISFSARTSLSYLATPLIPSPCDSHISWFNQSFPRSRSLLLFFLIFIIFLVEPIPVPTSLDFMIKYIKMCLFPGAQSYSLFLRSRPSKLLVGQNVLLLLNITISKKFLLLFFNSAIIKSSYNRIPDSANDTHSERSMQLAKFSLIIALVFISRVLRILLVFYWNHNFRFDHFEIRRNSGFTVSLRNGFIDSSLIENDYTYSVSSVLSILPSHNSHFESIQKVLGISF